MATIDMSAGTAAHDAATPFRSVPYLREMEVDFAVATTTKGSALAASDVIQTLDIPAGTAILFATMEVTEAMTGTSTDLALDLGITGGDVDNFVDGFDFDGASVGDYATPVAYGTGTKPLVVTADDTLDILIQAQTGTFTGGKVKVKALVVDLTGQSAPGHATAGS